MVRILRDSHGALAADQCAAMDGAAGGDCGESNQVDNGIANASARHIQPKASRWVVAARGRLSIRQPNGGAQGEEERTQTLGANEIHGAGGGPPAPKVTGTGRPGSEERERQRE